MDAASQRSMALFNRNAKTKFDARLQASMRWMRSS